MAEPTGSSTTNFRLNTSELLINQEAYGKNRTYPILDLTRGGQHGWSPVLTEWVSNQAYVRRQLIPILLEAPQFFQKLNDSDKYVETLRSLVELHPQSIEGFNAALTVETVNHPVGGAGELQDEYVDVKRARSEPVFTFVEKYGMPIQNFLHNWITYGLMDPDTKTALVGTLEEGSVPPDLLASWYSMTMLFIEPDPNHRRVMKSWITTNMFPTTTGEIIGKRDLTTGSEILTLSIQFTGISQFNLGTNAMAQEILDQINISNANPHLRPAFVEEISEDVRSADNGYNKRIEDLVEEAGQTEEKITSLLPTTSA